MNGQAFSLFLKTDERYGRRPAPRAAGAAVEGLMQGVFGALPMAGDGQVLVKPGRVHRRGEWQPYWTDGIAWMRAQTRASR